MIPFMDWDQFTGVFAEAVEGVTVGMLREDTAYKQLPSWDSLAVLTLIDAVDETSGVLLRKADFGSSATLGELHRCVVDKL